MMKCLAFSPSANRTVHLDSINGLTIRAAEYRDQPRAEFPMCFTPEAMRVLAKTVFRLVPETGAKGFSIVNRFGFEIAEFDERGSLESSGAIYKPDVQWGSARCEYYLHQPEEQMRLWSGDLHSHPGGIGRPSGRSGPGLGDLGYVQAVFEANEAMQFFAMPIVVGAGTSQVTIHPWICMRDRPLQLLAAEVRICEVDKFPDRVFNPAWEQTVSEQKELIAQPFAIRVDVLRQHLQHASVRTVVEIKDALLLERAGLEIIVAIPQNFPLVPPQLKIRRPTGLQEFSPIPWAKFSVTSPEERLARLCNWIFNAYLMRF